MKFLIRLNLLILALLLILGINRVMAASDRAPIDQLLDSITNQVEGLNFRLNRINALDERMRNIRKKLNLPEENIIDKNATQDQKINALEQQIKILEDKAANCSG